MCMHTQRLILCKIRDFASTRGALHILQVTDSTGFYTILLDFLYLFILFFLYFLTINRWHKLLSTTRLVLVQTLLYIHMHTLI